MRVSLRGLCLEPTFSCWKLVATANSYAQHGRLMMMMMFVVGNPV